LQPTHLDNRAGRDDAVSLNLADELICRAEGIDQDAEITFATSHEYRIEAYKMRVERLVQVQIKFVEPKPWAELSADWVRTLQHFLIVALGRPVQLVKAFAVPSGYDGHRGWPRVITPWLQRDINLDPSLTALYSYTTSSLIPGDQFIANCQTLLDGWWRVARAHEDAITRLTAPSYARFMYFENECAVIAQAFESLYLESFSSKRELPRLEHRARVDRVVEALSGPSIGLPDVDVEWARNVLGTRNDKSFGGQVAEILGLVGSRLEALLAERVPELPREIEGLRHAVSHGRAPGSDQRRRTNREAQYFVKELATWMLRVALLNEAGFDAASAHAADNHNVNFAIDRLRQLRQTSAADQISDEG
jgi:hypothetical protein